MLACNRRASCDIGYQRANAGYIFYTGGINIYQGNMTLTLGMIWMLIQKYQIRIHGKCVEAITALATRIETLYSK